MNNALIVSQNERLGCKANLEYPTVNNGLSTNNSINRMLYVPVDAVNVNSTGSSQFEN